MTKTLTQGCPQGSCLSPTLWNVYANDLLEEIEHSTKANLIGFADDLTIYLTMNKTKRGTKSLQKALNIAQTWATKWKIKFNTSKTKAIIFSKRRNKFSPIFKLDNEKIDIVKSHRYLGIIFDEKLTWKNHVEKISQKATDNSIKLAACSRLNWGLGGEVMKSLYTTCIQPILTYGCMVWASATTKATYINLLRRAQRIAALSITGCLRTTSTDAVLVLAGIIPIEITLQELAARATEKAWNNINLRERRLVLDDAFSRSRVTHLPTNLPCKLVWIN